jgi:oligosaccharide repeat unit polymerase
MLQPASSIGKPVRVPNWQQQQQVHRVLACSVAGVLPALSWVASETGLAVYAAFAFLLVAEFMFVTAAYRSFGSCCTLATIFSSVAVLHACVAYLLVDLIAPDIWPASTFSTHVSTAFLIVSGGILSASLGYFAFSESIFASARHLLETLVVDDGRLIRIALLITLTGAVLIFGIYGTVGYLPLLSDNPGQSRYLTEDISESYRVDQWLIQRGLDLITIAVPLLLWNWRRKWVYSAAATVGIIACLLPLRRTPFLVIAITLGALRLVAGGRIRKGYVITAVAVLVAYGASQLLFLPSGSEQVGSQRLLYATAASATEIRDLAWMMSRSNEPWYGVTFLQPLVPLPSLAGDFSQKYKLGEITIHLMQLEDDRRTGGLRMTLAGEAYMNFGFFGVAVLGFLFGALCALVDRLSYWVKGRHNLGASYAVALIFVWLCFWIYLSGSGMAAALKISILLATIIFFISRRKHASDEVTPA